MKSANTYQFSQVPKVQMPRSVFDRSHAHKTTFNSGYLVPFYTDEMLPGDTFNAKATLFARLATPIFPIMDNIYLDTFYFFVPNRLVWSNWKKFNGEQASPYDIQDYIDAESFSVPVITPPDTVGFINGSIFDHMGMPTGISSSHSSWQPMALYNRAYNLIWNEWFRDENLQDPVPVPMGDGPDPYTLYNLLMRGKRHDYFTSCLPWPQKGPAVPLPIGSTAPVFGNGKSIGLSTGSTPFSLIKDHSTTWPTISPSSDAYNTARGTSSTLQTPPYYDLSIGVVESGESGMFADLTNATASSINQLRQAFQIQRLYERDARGGTRYTEIIRSHFCVVSPDARQQRPEYLGGGSQRMNIHPVQQTSGTANAVGGVPSTTPQGNLAAYGVIACNNGFKYSATEHGVIIGLVNVRADLTYQQGMPRKYTRRTRWDYYWPALAHLGEQPVYNREIYTSGGSGDLTIFGYQERWAEYRYFPNEVTGQFRSNFSTPLDAWHLAEKFATQPALNDVFISTPPPIGRVVAVPSYPQIIFDSFMSLHCARPMPVYSVPGLIDHF